MLDFSENNDFNKNGLDKVEFFIATNVGEEEKPLITIPMDKLNQFWLLANGSSEIGN